MASSEWSTFFTDSSIRASPNVPKRIFSSAGILLLAVDIYLLFRVRIGRLPDGYVTGDT